MSEKPIEEAFGLSEAALVAAVREALYDWGSAAGDAASAAIHDLLAADGELVDLRDLLIEAVGHLQWCSGSADFNEGGIARVGWMRGPQPFIERAIAALSSPASAVDQSPAAGSWELLYDKARARSDEWSEIANAQGQKLDGIRRRAIAERERIRENTDEYASGQRYMLALLMLWLTEEKPR